MTADALREPGNAPDHFTEDQRRRFYRKFRMLRESGHSENAADISAVNFAADINVVKAAKIDKYVESSFRAGNLRSIY